MRIGKKTARFYKDPDQTARFYRGWEKKTQDSIGVGKKKRKILWGLEKKPQDSI